MKIKGGTNASENFRVDRFETYGAETQLDPTTMPLGAERPIAISVWNQLLKPFHIRA
jgi:hypothetical protein